MYKIFLSHSVKDMSIVRELESVMSMVGADVYLAVDDPQPGRELGDKVGKNIQSSNIIVVLLTADGERSEWVQREIVYAKKLKKMVIPIVEEGVTPPEVIRSIEYIPFNRSDHSVTFTALYSRVSKLAGNNTIVTFLLVAAIAGFILWLILKE